MQQLTKNVYTETEIRGCDPSIVLTSEGAVFIDTAQWITNLEQMIAFAEEKAGRCAYLINTESHIDHIFGNHWLKKAGATIIGQEKILDSFFKIPPAFNMTTHDYNVDIIKEARKALETVDRDKFSSDEEYEKAVHEFEEQWWDMGQPALGMRSPNDAIYETLGKYRLNEE